MNDLELLTILNTMDIPQMRKDITSAANVKWLLRNISIRNAKHSQLESVIKTLKEKLNEL